MIDYEELFQNPKPKLKPELKKLYVHPSFYFTVWAFIWALIFLYISSLLASFMQSVIICVALIGFLTLMAFALLEIK